MECFLVNDLVVYRGQDRMYLKSKCEYQIINQHINLDGVQILYVIGEDGEIVLTTSNECMSIEENRISLINEILYGTL